MKAEWRKYLGANVPRYTSYPSALAFQDDFSSAPYEEALSRVGLYEPISLYIHIPFCQQLCFYCGCNMRVENRYERITRYVDALIAEVAAIGAALAGRGRVTHLHFGGGTPNMLRAAELETIFDAVEHAFGLTDQTPIAMEIDPRLMGPFQAAQYVRLGVKRFSIGVQDFDHDVQSAINRLQDFELVENCMARLRGNGVKDISLDLLYGLPKQTDETFKQTIVQTVALRPERISLFGYAHMPTKFRHQSLIKDEDLPSRDQRTDLCEMAADMLTDAGYERIGFDHFALPGTPIAEAARSHRLNRNFQGYTEDSAAAVIGFGVSAISSVGGVFAQNEKTLPAYYEAISAGHLPTARGTVSTYEQEDLWDWIKRLLCDMEASLAAYCEITDLNAFAYEDLLQRLQVLVDDGLVELDGDRVRITKEAKPLARTVAAAFDPAVTAQAAFASPAV